MSRLVFLLEERSMQVLLEGMLPRLFPELPFLCIPHEGKQSLEQSIPRKLRAWNEPGARFCVVRDNDGADCTALKQQLVDLCCDGRRDDALVRIACQELEAWYFGEPGALADEFQRENLRGIHEKARYRVPDAINRPSRELTKLVAEFQKVGGARRLARRLSRANRSESFRALLAGIERLQREMQENAQGDDE